MIDIKLININYYISNQSFLDKFNSNMKIQNIFKIYIYIFKIYIIYFLITLQNYIISFE